MGLDDLRRRWVDSRNRILSSPAFQRFALRFPLTRPIARRRARNLFDVVAGFTYSQTLFACVETGLLAFLETGGKTFEEVAAHTGLPAKGAQYILHAAAALDLVEQVGDTWMLGQAGAALAADPGITAMVAHHHALYADLADPVALLRRGGGGGALSRYWAYAESPGTGDAGVVAPYSRLMAASLPMVARQALGAYDFRRHRRMLDVGGGEGAFLMQVATAAPDLALGLYDLPAVIDRAGERLAAAGLDARVALHPGSFISGALPDGYDLITLVRILHDHDDEPACTLLRAIHDALPAGGRLLIVEPMAGTPGVEPAGETYFGLYLLAMGSGRPRLAAEICRMLVQSGFAAARELRTNLPLAARAIIADR